MSASPSLSTRLNRAAAKTRLVRVHRKPGWDVVEGYVVDTGPKWVLLSMVDDRARADGFSAVRRRDISSVRRAKGCERFTRRALELDGSWPPSRFPGEIDLGRTRGVVASFAASFPLITLSIEREDPDVAFIGKAQVYGPKSFSLRDITPNAEWAGPRPRDWSEWTFRELSRIDAGGGYEAALAAVGGDPPADG